MDEDQIALRDSLREMLGKECPPSVLRCAWVDPTGIDLGLWNRLGEMGLFSLLVPAEAGGLGLGEIEMVVAMEECGRVALPGPLIEQCVAVPVLAATPPLATRWLQAAMSGEAVVTFGPVGDAARRAVGTPWGDVCDLALVERGDELVALEVRSSDVAVTAQRVETVDRSWRSARLGSDGGQVVPGGVVLARAAWERGALSTAAFMVGLASAVVEMTVGYVKEREQFGVPVGSFQAIKHHIADAYLAVEYARPVVWRAAYALSHAEASSARDVSFAKVRSSLAAGLAARKALQCHGAIGYCFEHDLHLWMKRIWTLALHWGDEDSHRARVAGALLGRSSTSEVSAGL